MHTYQKSKHTASKTDDYIFNQLIPYIGNKRKLLGLIDDAIALTKIDPATSIFFDLFSGSGVVSRFAKKLGFRVVANDWEPYSEQINKCYIERNAPPSFKDGTTYAAMLEKLNNLSPIEDWVTKHLCPDCDESFDTKKDRMFYTRVNGMKIDAIREKLNQWISSGAIDETSAATLIAPLIYQACYTSNTSGVFKGFHNGWGGQTGTALYRIKSSLTLSPAIFYDNHRRNEVFRQDAFELAASYPLEKSSIAYIDPPYNQHPYGSNYHVLNSITLWDKPELSKKIEVGNKSAIREDWRAERRSKYNYKNEALAEYEKLLSAIKSEWILTSYSTDGNIPLRDMVNATCEIGATKVVTMAYKRYRVSSQRFSQKPLNVEFVLVTQKGAKNGQKTDEIVRKICEKETEMLQKHPENSH